MTSAGSPAEVIPFELFGQRSCGRNFVGKPATIYSVHGLIVTPVSLNFNRGNRSSM
jgi:hypothetical protein